MSTLMAILMAAGCQDDLTTRLERTKVSVDFRDASISDAVDFFRDFSGMNIILGQGVEDVRVSLKLKDVSLKSALKLMLHPHDLTATVREGVIVIVPRAEVRRNVTLQVYDVRDLMFRVKEFAGPTIELKVNEPGIIQPQFPQDEPIMEDENFLLEIVKTHIEWGENATVEYANGMLFVTQTKSGHSEVSNLLGRMRLFK